VRPEHHDLVSLVGAGNLADDVEHHGIEIVRILDVGFDCDRQVLREHPRHAAVLLRRDDDRGQRLRRIRRAAAADHVNAVAARGG
jgi:hypothetical protein